MKENITTSVFLSAEYLANLKTLKVIATKDHIPEKEFRQDFTEILAFCKKNPLNYLIFDKSRLEIFHLKSMEWYYIEVQKQLFSNGLKRFYKILPNKPWFNEDLVKKAILEIQKRHQEMDFTDFNLQYVPSVESAMEEIQS